MRNFRKGLQKSRRGAKNRESPNRSSSKKFWATRQKSLGAANSRSAAGGRHPSYATAFKKYQSYGATPIKTPDRSIITFFIAVNVMLYPIKEERILSVNVLKEYKAQKRAFKRRPDYDHLKSYKSMCVNFI